MENTVHTFTDEDMVGTLCVDEQANGYLHYNYKYSNTSVDTVIVTDGVWTKANKFCKDNGINLIMY